MSSISTRGIGIIVLLVNLGLEAFNVQVPDGAVEGAVEAILSVVGLGLLIFGQLRDRRYKAGLIRKGAH
jgi:hypothetical protein